MSGVRLSGHIVSFVEKKEKEKKEKNEKGKSHYNVIAISRKRPLVGR